MTTTIPEPSRPRYQPAILRTPYEAWRVTYQSSEQAARAAFSDACQLRQQREELLAALKETHGVLMEFVALARKIDDTECLALIARMGEGK